MRNNILAQVYRKNQQRSSTIDDAIQHVEDYDTWLDAQDVRSPETSCDHDTLYRQPKRPRYPRRSWRHGIVGWYADFSELTKALDAFYSVDQWAIRGKDLVFPDDLDQ